MDAAGDQFLARAGLAGNENSAVGLCDPTDGLAQMVHHTGGANQLGGVSGAGFQILDLSLQGDASSARSATRIKRSALNGFSMKS